MVGEKRWTFFFKSIKVAAVSMTVAFLLIIWGKI